jgi:hypothetical protein
LKTSTASSSASFAAASSSFAAVSVRPASPFVPRSRVRRQRRVRVRGRGRRALSRARVIVVHRHRLVERANVDAVRVAVGDHFVGIHVARDARIEPRRAFNDAKGVGFVDLAFAARSNRVERRRRRRVGTIEGPGGD